MDWIKQCPRFLLALLTLLVVSSCAISYKFNGASIDYTKVSTIQIDYFPLKSMYNYSPLGTTFNEKLKDIYAAQTRLSQVKNGGDMIISGEITNYQQLNQAVKSDGYSSETQLKVTVNVRFVNNTNHEEDFEQQFSAFRNYDSSLQLTSVQDGLIEEMVKEIVEQIFNATVANW
ncbi:MAG: LptE family protein [Bacteroidaceae bacterium]|nr:LptE family protein [Bacteroidaceae bacterium]